ncbi:RHS repeat-associated core domain-containing protein [Pseudomonas ovata]|uniref:RHS repeat-associated core domain-containing protein n=1 Tax=Pseudomonas ovata TaxID=1839709 RepID=UPI003BAD5C80
MKHSQQRRTTLYATDRPGSLLAQLQTGQPDRFAYAPFGHRSPAAGIGFNGELPDPLTGHYLLGNGHRAYNPVLMRFNSPDRLSPFGKGGVNAYAYCGNDPVNRSDPSGQFAVFNAITRSLMKMGKRVAVPVIMGSAAGSSVGLTLLLFSDVSEGERNVLIAMTVVTAAMTLGVGWKHARNIGASKRRQYAKGYREGATKGTDEGFDSGRIIERRLAANRHGFRSLREFRSVDGWPRETSSIRSL